ncbi:MAG TPA: glycosyltransferase family A protein [Candidatus Deferrimicrobiaceae bacterium]|jgi:glycosyltransferase involved in cell wall biosynthesis
MASLGRKISVCLVTYNHENLVESTLRTVLEQDIDGYELLVSDDCSTDGTWEKVVEMAETDSRIVPIRTPRNLGMAGNANYVVSQAARPYIALLHHDDLYRHDMLRKWGALMDRHPDAGFVFNSYGVHGSDRIDDEPFSGELIDGATFLERHLFPRWGCPVRGTALIRRDAWAEVGGMREAFGLLADVDLWMRLARRFPVGYVPEPVIVTRQERPDYYPGIYTGRSGFWKRQRFLYEIHGTNREETYRGFRRTFEMTKFRMRVTRETIKWLGYAVLRGNMEMIGQSSDGICRFEMAPARAARVLAAKFFPGAGRPSGSAQ